MIRVLRRIIFRRRVPKLRAEVAALERQYLEALKGHRARAHILARLQDKRHQLIKCQTGF